MIKLNIAVLLILQGKRDNALVVLYSVYRNRDCLIEFMQSRIFLLLLVTHQSFRNSTRLLKIHSKCCKSIDITYLNL